MQWDHTHTGIRLDPLPFAIPVDVDAPNTVNLLEIFKVKLREFIDTTACVKPKGRHPEVVAILEGVFPVLKGCEETPKVIGCEYRSLIFFALRTL